MKSKRKLLVLMCGCLATCLFLAITVAPGEAKTVAGQPVAVLAQRGCDAIITVSPA